jgi:hypothetical protein
MPLLIIAAAVALYFLVKWLRGRRREPPPRPQFVPPTFRVAIVGPSGVGKTTFLSSLFHTLNFRTPGRSYHLETAPDERIALAGVFNKVSDPAQPWPAGTKVAEAHEYVFDCVGTGPDDVRHAVLRVKVDDYAGELLHIQQKPGAGAALQNLVDRITGAHALLALIDGRNVLQLLRGEPAGHAYFSSTTQPMFGLMQSVSCPIHLVLTKWDLIRDFGEPPDAGDEDRLSRVIEALMAYEHIASVVRVNDRRRTVRLIPVSAVGPGFAELNADGKVIKRPDGKVRPTNVEVPFCAVLPDLFRQVESDLRDSDIRTLRRLRHDPARLLGAAAQLLSGTAFTALQVLSGGTLGATMAVQMFVDWMDSPPSSNGRVDRDLGDLQSVRRAVMEDFTRSVLRMEASFPNSQLTKAW